MTVQKDNLAVVALIVAIVSLIASVMIFVSRPSITSVESALVAELVEHERLLAALEKRGAGSQGAAALATYLRLARKDGVASQASLRTDLNALERNTARILAYLDLYERSVSDAEELNVIRAFRAYGIALLDREDALLELYMLGGGYGVSAPSYPAELRSTISSR
jgi:hypothetical protein